jgi:catechol 2,3-dioxygenase-like lactoylglutathione lyase family enzyme
MSGHVERDEQMVIELYVGNIKESKEFYKSLGFEVVREEGNHVELRWGHALLFLEETSKAPLLSSNPVGNLRILVSNVDHYWILSQKLGIPVVQSIENRNYGLRDFTLTGPDGLGLRFATRILDLET